MNSAPTRTATLDVYVAAAEEILREHALLEPPDFRRDHETTELYWRVREGMQGLVAEFRPLGTSLILEDVCVPPERVAEAAQDLQALLGKHGFLVGRGRATPRPATCTSCSRRRSATPPTATATTRSCTSSSTSSWASTTAR